MDLNDRELLLMIKSIEITCSVTADRIDRLPDPSRQRAKALAELELGRELAYKLNHEHSKRLGLSA